MPMYYFHLRDQQTVQDVDGTELADTDAARAHADNVAQELKFKTDEFLGHEWSRWSMCVNDHEGNELFSFPMSGNGATDGK